MTILSKRYYETSQKSNQSQKWENHIKIIYSSNSASTRWADETHEFG